MKNVVADGVKGSREVVKSKRWYFLWSCSIDEIIVNVLLWHDILQNSYTYKLFYLVWFVLCPGLTVVALRLQAYRSPCQWHELVSHDTGMLAVESCGR